MDYDDEWGNGSDMDGYSQGKDKPEVPGTSQNNSPQPGPSPASETLGACNAIHSAPVGSAHNKVCASKGFSARQIAEASSWAEYVKGNIRKPSNRMVAPTMISCGHSEPARNKPVVIGRCAGEKTKLLLDSGAETNVIDSGFVNWLMQMNAPLKFTPRMARLRCANGTPMTVTGEVSLTLQVGLAKVPQRFMVVQNLFPRVIIGIRTMKTMNIILDPSNDCIVVGDGQRVPFLSRSDAETVVPAPQQENGQGTSAGAKGNPQVPTRLH